MLINMGPQHPSTHGVLRLALRTDGEVVTKSLRTSVTSTGAPKRSAKTLARASSCRIPTGSIIWPA